MGTVECGWNGTCLGAGAWEQEDDGARANMEGSRLQGEESGPGTQWEAAVNLGGEECGVRTECWEGFHGWLSTLLPTPPLPRYGVLLCFQGVWGMMRGVV